MKILFPVCLAFALIHFARSAETAWPGFRNAGNSVSKAENLPLDWSDESGIAWRIGLAGYGQSSPVISDGIVWVTSTSGAKKETLHLEGFDLTTGDLRVGKKFPSSVPVPEVTRMISQGAPTPVVDQAGVYAFFESGDLFAIDLDGEVRWQKDFQAEYGEFIGGHGIGSSLVQTPDHLYVLVDHDGPSYLLSIRKRDGHVMWKTEREPRVSWTTPLLVDFEGVPQIIVSSNGEVDSSDLATGAQLWKSTGWEGNNVPSPTQVGDLLLIASSQPQQSKALRLKRVEPEKNSKAPRVEPNVAWTAESVTSSFGSPAAFRGMALFVNKAGVLQAVSLEDGASLWETRLPGSLWASPVVAGDRVYFFCQGGATVVLSPTVAGPGEALAENILTIPEDAKVYGVAFVDGSIVLRTGTELVGIHLHASLE